MNMEAGKTVIIVGAFGGIGTSITCLLLKKGFWVIALTHRNRTEPDLITLQEEWAGLSVIDNIDYNDTQGLKQKLSSISKTYVYDHIVICNGYLKVQSYLMGDDDSLRDSYEKNFVFPMSLVRSLIRPFLRRGRSCGASVLFMSSVSVRLGTQGRIAYVAGKAALESAVKVLAQELGRYGVRVNCLAPGLISTNMLYENTSTSDLCGILQRIPMGRVGQPSEIASVVEFMLSDSASYINAATIPIDGGMV